MVVEEDETVRCWLMGIVGKKIRRDGNCFSSEVSEGEGSSYSTSSSSYHNNLGIRNILINN